MIAPHAHWQGAVPVAQRIPGQHRNRPAAVAAAVVSRGRVCGSRVCQTTAAVSLLLGPHRKRLHRRTRPVVRSVQGCAAELPLKDLSIEALNSSFAEQGHHQLLEWLYRAYSTINEHLFQGRLHKDVHITLDTSWHLQGGAGGANFSLNAVVLDPSAHTSLLSLVRTLVHEMIHLDIGDNDSDDHGPAFLARCEEVIGCVSALSSQTNLPLALICRVGEHDLCFDLKDLGQVMGWSKEECLAFARKKAEPMTMAADDFASSLRSRGCTDAAILQLMCTCALRACRRAGASSAPGGYDAWRLRSRMLVQHCALRAGSDYALFEDLDSIWKL